MATATATGGVPEVRRPDPRFWAGRAVCVGASRAPGPVDEESPFELEKLRVDYVHAKRAAERLALEGPRPAVVTNPGYLLGPEDHERSVMGRLCARFWRGRVPLAPPGG